LWHGLATIRWFPSGTLLSSTNKTDRHDITEILLKVPFIYAFYDSRFRREFKMMFTAAEHLPEMEGTSEERTASKDRTLDSKLRNITRSKHCTNGNSYFSYFTRNFVAL
jgi:hypothetical protein